MILPSSFSNPIILPNSLIHSSIYWHKFHLHLQTWTYPILLFINTNSISIFKSEHTPIHLFISTDSILHPQIWSCTQFLQSSTQILFSILKSNHTPKFIHQHKVPILHLQIRSTHSFLHSSTQIPSPSFSPPCDASPGFHIEYGLSSILVLIMLWYTSEEFGCFCFVAVVVVVQVS